MSRYLLFFIVFAAGFGARADSPLTSTNPAVAYKHVDFVAKELADEQSTFSLEECEFLSSPGNPLDHKFAFINALGWGDSTHVETYTQFLMKRYKLPHTVFDSLLTWRGSQPGAYAPAAALVADDYACLAYLQAMGDYFRPLRAYYCAYHAADLKPGSGAAAYIIGLVMAQFYLDNDWCKVYGVMVGVREYDGYTEDILAPAAVANIFEYIDAYEQGCTEQQRREAEAAEADKNRLKQNLEVYQKPAYPQLMEDKKNYVDLEVISIAAPEYVESIDGSRIVVKIKNRGTISSIETNARLKDLDITAAEARKRKFDKLWIQAISENNGRANDNYGEGENMQAGVDYDKNWELMLKIPVLQPGEEVELIFELKNYWIYDSNCEIEIDLDLDQNIQEKNEDNNKKAFVAWG